MRPVNLLPEPHRARVSTGRSGGAYVLIGVLAAFVVMATVYALTANQVNSRKTQEAKASQEAQRLEAQTASLKNFGDFMQVKQTRLNSVRELAGGRFDWERFMRELSLVLPRGSWIKEVDASTTGSAEAGTPATGQPSAKLTGCTPRQPETAKLMVRLRRLHRVDDVTLKESAQESTGGAATLANCGKLYAFDITVSFLAAPPPEGAGSPKHVPASLGGGE
jgi:Tfp pilus assembly protein PilN